jgi:hypothetical protein
MEYEGMKYEVGFRAEKKKLLLIFTF